jgi:hypothetical protein
MMAKVSYERHIGKYLFRWFYNLAYFILIIILMLEMVFGIIVETFRELRIDQQKHDADKHDKCFICGIKRDEIEKIKKNFEEHVNVEHNLWNYVNYMIRLKFSDPHDLNAINSYALDLLEGNLISWIPIANKNVKEKYEEEEILKRMELAPMECPADEHEGLPDEIIGENGLIIK